MYAVEFHGVGGYEGYCGGLSLPQALQAARSGRDPRGCWWFDMSAHPVALVHRMDERINSVDGSHLPAGRGHVINRCAKAALEGDDE